MPAARQFALALLLTLGACSLPANVVVLIPDEGGTVGKAVVSGAGGTAELAGADAAVGTAQGEPPGRVFVANPVVVGHAFRGALAATPRPAVIYVVYFLSGSTQIDPRSQGELARAISAARSTANADIGVVGHSDATGTDAQNLPLSQARAQAVRDALLAGGVSDSIIETAYHGSGNPRVPRPQGVAEPENRRVEVTIR
jgi:outer membrane protein OmpA-like peptidoglycan-associated protein